MAQQKSSYKPKISPRNKELAEKIRTYAKAHSIIGVIDVSGLPAPQFQRIRSKLNKTAKILIVKKNLIELVLNELESEFKGISELANRAVGVVGLVFTNDNPFTLYKYVSKNKSSAPAKGGQVAPNDIVVPAGPTGFTPGPIIGELGAFKILAGIEDGKVAVKQDAVVAKEGDVISNELAAILSRLGIEPMEVGLNIKGLYEGGTVYGKDVLEVDEDAILADLQNEARRAFQLSIGLDYYTNENIGHFLGEGSRDSLALGVGIAYPAAETLKTLVLKAQAQMVGVANTLPEGVKPAGLAAAAAAPVASDSSSDANEGTQETKEEVKEEDTSAGLAGLF